MEKGKEGFVKVVDFNQSINTDQVSENVYPFDDGVAPHLQNTGILHDQSVTNLYTTATDASGTYDKVMYAPNGAKVSWKYNGTITRLYLNDEILPGSLGSFVTASRDTVPKNAIDFTVTSTGTYLILYATTSATASNNLAFTIQEWFPSTNTFGTSYTTNGSFGLAPAFYRACLVKMPQSTINNTGIALCTGFGDYYYISNSSGTFTNNLIATSATGAYQDRGISAFGVPGRVAIGGVADGSGAPRTYYNTTFNNYATWTAVNESSFLYCRFIPVETATSVNLIAYPSNMSTTNHTTYGTSINITSAGVVTVTPNTVAGLTIVPSDTYNGFGFNSGRYKSTAATKFSPFIATSDSNSVSVSKKDYTASDYVVRPQGFIKDSLFGVVTINGVASHYTYGPGNDGYGAPALTEPGTADPYRCMTEFYIASTGKFILCAPVVINGTQSLQHIVSYSVQLSSSTLFTFTPISKDVVVFNNEYGTILDTKTGYVEWSYGGVSNSFYSDAFLSGTNLVAWQSLGKYTNAIDLGINPGIVSGATGVAGVTPSASIASAIKGAKSKTIWYQGTAGSVFSVCYTYNFYGSASVSNIAYVPNSNLPAPADAVYTAGGIQMKSFSALQTINESDADGYAQYYAGYTLANQYPIAYQFFNLFGTLYGYDGWKIYRMPVNGATAGTPEQVAYAQGLTLLTYSPKAALFVSSYDNSLYIYNGGQDVNKFAETTGVATIQSGVYSQRESAMFLQLSDNTVLIIRDDKISQLSNAYTSQTMTPTDNGVYFSNTASPAQYAVWSYQAGSGTPITLTWQSGYYGWGGDKMVFVNAIVFTLKVPSPSTTAITVNYKWIDGGANATETVTFAANSYTASSTGYVRLVVRPTQTKGYGVSFGIQCAQKVWLYDATLYYNDGGPGYNTVPVTNQLSTS